jgi:hypothetical protein
VLLREPTFARCFAVTSFFAFRTSFCFASFDARGPRNDRVDFCRKRLQLLLRPRLMVVVMMMVVAVAVWWWWWRCGGGGGGVVVVVAVWWWWWRCGGGGDRGANDNT